MIAWKNWNKSSDSKNLHAKIGANKNKDQKKLEKMLVLVITLSESCVMHKKGPCLLAANQFRAALQFM